MDDWIKPLWAQDSGGFSLGKHLTFQSFCSKIFCIFHSYQSHISFLLPLKPYLQTCHVGHPSPCFARQGGQGAFGRRRAVHLGTSVGGGFSFLCGSGATGGGADQGRWVDGLMVDGKVVGLKDMGLAN